MLSLVAKPLTPRQQIFVREYLISSNATDAARKAGVTGTPHAIEVTASRLLRNAEVASAIAAAVKAQAKRVEVRADDILQELIYLGHADLTQAYGPNGKLLPLKDMPVELRRSISSIEMDEAGNVVRIRLYAKPHALELLGKNQRLWSEKIILQGRLTLEQLIAGDTPTPEKE